MIYNQIQHAIAQVRELQQAIIEKQRFKGYSGRARAISGTLALLMAFIMSLPSFPQTATSHIAGWGVIFLIGLLLNFGVLIHWFLFDPKVQRDIRRLKPVVDALPPLFVGVVLTVSMILAGEYRFLFGIWMSLFGLANLSTRHALPKRIWMVGVFYITFGMLCLLSPEIAINNPWPVGIVFFIGEWVGGIVLHFDDTTTISIKNILEDFLKVKESHHVHQTR